MTNDVTRHEGIREIILKSKHSNLQLHEEIQYQIILLFFNSSKSFLYDSK